MHEMIKNITQKYMHNIEADRPNPTKAFLSFKCHKIWNEIQCVHRNAKNCKSPSFAIRPKSWKTNMLALFPRSFLLKEKEHLADRQHYLFALEKSLCHKRGFKGYCKRYTVSRMATHYLCFEFISHFPLSLHPDMVIKYDIKRQYVFYLKKTYIYGVLLITFYKCNVLVVNVNNFIQIKSFYKDLPYY